MSIARRDIGEPGVDRPAANEPAGMAGIDRIGLEAPGDEKAQHLVRGPRRIGRSADDRDRGDAGQDRRGSPRR